MNDQDRIEQAKARTRETFVNNAKSMAWLLIPLVVLADVSAEVAPEVEPWITGFTCAGIGFVGGLCACWILIRDL